jgi:MGT family glycosyltransferase
VLGHPSALTVGDEVYGYPPAWPRAFTPGPDALAELRRLSEQVRDDFTAQWNAALALLSPGATPSVDAFAETGDVLMLNYPAELHDHDRTALLPRHTFLGSAVRAEASDEQVETWLGRSDEPVVYVSLGSFLSARSDLLATIVEALRPLDVRVALAHGSTPRPLLGALPESWLVREMLPQVTLLGHASVAVSHGGNNSVTESLTAGVPLLLLPLSTDQFAGAAAVEAQRLGEVLDPNRADAAAIRSAAERLMGPADSVDRAGLHRLGASMREHPGPLRARDALTRQTTPAHGSGPATL